MKFAISLQELQKTLIKILPAIPPKATLPVLEHIHLTLEGNNLFFAATNQDIFVKSELSVEGIEDGSVLVPARKLNEVVKALGLKGNIDFEVNLEFDITIRTSMGKYSMKGISIDEYVDLPELFEIPKPDIELIQNSESNENSAFISKETISEIGNKTFFAVSDDDYRPAMTGVLFQFRGDKIIAVSTDSFRLVKIVKNYEKANLPQMMDVIIPAQTIDLLRKSDTDIVMTTITNMNNKVTHIRFDIGTTVIVSRVIDEKFPPYDSVIPKENTKIVITDKSMLLDAIKRVSLFVNQISKQLVIKINESTLEVFGQDQDTGYAGSEIIGCDYVGDSFQSGFNYSFLIEALNHLDTSDEGKVFLTFSEPTRPALLMADPVGENQLMLIMPVRIS
ncbi:MAG: DNA polymerase III subunit beta [Candidatus Kapabacteria bacterium]|nr:DNA polymerase III subunit beta [Candidatus Kapabacteria bacterium]